MTGTYNNLIDVLRKRCECCRAILELSQCQQTLIHESRMSELLQVIAKKQRVLADLNSLGQEFGGLPAHWKSVRHTLSDEERSVCGRILAKSESLLAQTLPLESYGIDVLTRHKETVRDEIQEPCELAQTLPVPIIGGGTPEPQFLDASR
jgi:hypothetical protein